MLRINLLPSYVTQRRLTRRLIPVFALLLLVCIAAPLAYYAKVQSDLKTLTAQADDAESGKGKTDALKAQASSTLALVGPIKDKLQFVEDVHAYPLKYVSLYSNLAETTPRSSFIYTGAQLTGTNMAIKAYSPSVEDVGRYLQVMYHEPDFQTVSVDKVPGYPDNIRHFYYLDGVLVFADGATSSGGGGGFSGGRGGFAGGPPPGFAGGRGGFPGGRGGFPGGGFTGGGATGGNTPENIGPNAPANLPPGVGPPPAELTGGVAGSGTASRGYPGAAGGTQAGAGGYSPKFVQVALRDFGPFAPADVRDRALRNALRRVVTKTVPKGFDINVTAVLKQPLVAPSLPGSAPAGGAAAPSAFPGGPPAGFGGPPPGYRPGAPATG